MESFGNRALSYAFFALLYRSLRMIRVRVALIHSGHKWKLLWTALQSSNIFDLSKARIAFELGWHN